MFTIHVLSTIAIFKRVAIEKITVPRGPELQYFPINICKLTAAIEKEQLVPDPRGSVAPRAPCGRPGIASFGYNQGPRNDLYVEHFYTGV